MKKNRAILYRLIKLFFCLAFVGILAILALDYWVSSKTASVIYHDVEQLPARKIGLVLGTSKYVRGGGYNEFYQHRIQGAIALYKAGKVQMLLLSGDNRLLSYNEPRMMYRDLIKAGVPEEAIILDFAGFRTLDSIVRAKKVFAADDFTIITQQFHCERAIFIAQSQGIKAQCYAVKTPNKTFFIRIREIFARLSAFSDVYILKRQPKFLGPMLPIAAENSAE